MLVPSHSTSTRRPSARRRYASRSTVSGVRPGPGVEHHEAPHGVHGIDDPNVRPSALAIDRDEERRWLTAVGLKQIRSAEIHMHGVAERLAVETNAERAANQTIRAIASD